MDSSFLFYIFLAVGTLISLVIALVFLLPKILKNLGGRGRGWTTLAEHFPATSQPSGELFKRQTIEVGRVAIGITPQGLYLESNFPFSSRLNPLFIPWEMVKGVREGTLYWEKTRILSIGEPEIGTISFFQPCSRRPAPI